MAARRLVGSIGLTDIDVGRCSKSDIHVDVWSAGLRRGYGTAVRGAPFSPQRREQPTITWVVARIRTYPSWPAPAAAADPPRDRQPARPARPSFAM
jgi:hypothetical protein